MAVSCDTQISVPKGRIRADELATTIPASGWQIRSAGQGSKGERLYAWAYTSLDGIATGTGGKTPRHHRGLLIRRNPHTGELAYFLCHATTAVPTRNAGAGGRDPLAGRRELPSRQGLRRPGRTPGAHLDLLAPLDHPRDARPRLPRRHRRTSPTGNHHSRRQHHIRRHRTPSSADSPYLQRDPAPPCSTDPAKPRPTAHRPMESIPPTTPTPSETLPLQNATETRSRSTAVVLVLCQ